MKTMGMLVGMGCKADRKQMPNVSISASEHTHVPETRYLRPLVATVFVAPRVPS
jgi:hypothetical protein